MTARLAAAVLMLVALSAGSRATPDRSHTPRLAAGYQVLACDFHVHSLPLSWSTFSPFDTVLEARREGLDAIAMSGHNNVWVSLVGAWFSRLIGGPTVLPAEEIHTPAFHIVAVGIRDAVSWRLPAAAAIAEIHRQGGIAIAAHPLVEYWPGFDPAAMRLLDAAEVVHPEIFGKPYRRPQLRRFFARRPFTAIGSSDFHGRERMGLARTYVFASANTEPAILDALRHGRTVVYDRDGAVFGDPALIRLGVVPPLAKPRATPWDYVSRIAGVLSLLIAIALLRGGN